MNKNSKRREMSVLQAVTPARIGTGKCGPRPLTGPLLSFRADHAFAKDTVYGNVSTGLLQEFNLFTVSTQAAYDKELYLKRPDLGRKLDDESISLIKKNCTPHPEVQIIVSDGLSAFAIEANLKDIFPAIMQSLEINDINPGTPFFLKGGRVAAMDYVGEILQPETVVMIIGERPGLVTDKSMSVYMCYRPRKGTVESDRCVISNIHEGGTPPAEAGAIVGDLVKKMLEHKTSGINFTLNC